MQKPKQSDMLEAFLKMTPIEQEYVFQHVQGKIEGVEIAYRAAKNIRKFEKINKETA